MVGWLAVAGCGSDRDNGSGDAQLQSPQEASMPAAGSGGDPRSDQSANGGRPDQKAVAAQERHVVRTASLSVRVDDVTTAAAGARGVAERFGGFVASEQSESEMSSLTLRVEADRLDDALAALDELGDVTHREQQAEDVTEEVVDVDARIANQRASVERVRALLARATTVGEVVEVEAELTKRQAELESLENRAAALAGQTSLATVSVRLTGKGTPVLDDERTGFLAGLESGWNAFLVTLAVMLTVFGAVLPFLLVLGLPLLGVVLVLRQRRTRATSGSGG